MADVDLESLATGYAHRPPIPGSLARAGAAWEASGAQSGEVAVDVGGGLGRHAAVWAAAGARALVVDPAAGMVRSAATLPGVAAIRARAEAVPLGDGYAALVRFDWSLHHTDWPLAIREAARLLRRGGRLEIATPSPDDVAGSHLARWFPAMIPIDLARFPDVDQLTDAVTQAGFVDVQREHDVAPIHRRVGDWVAVVEAGFVSSLQLLSPGERAAGVARFREQHPDPDGVVSYDVRYESLAATAPR